MTPGMLFLYQNWNPSSPTCILLIVSYDTHWFLIHSVTVLLHSWTGECNVKLMKRSLCVGEQTVARFGLMHSRADDREPLLSPLPPCWLLPSLAPYCPPVAKPRNDTVLMALTAMQQHWHDSSLMWPLRDIALLSKQICDVIRLLWPWGTRVQFYSAISTIGNHWTSQEAQRTLDIKW